MRILVAGATGSIGIHVVNTAIAMGHQPVALVRNRRKIKLLPRGTDIFYGDVSIPETLTDLPKDILVVIRCPCNLKILSFFVKCNNPGNYILRATTN